MSKVTTRVVSRPVKKKASRNVFKRVAPATEPRKPAVLKMVDGLPVFDVPYADDTDVLELARAERDKQILGL
ncbi:MAG: hypothetical protein AAF708_10550 [Deinococcota bacterium]